MDHTNGIEGDQIRVKNGHNIRNANRPKDNKNESPLRGITVKIDDFL